MIDPITQTILNEMTFDDFDILVNRLSRDYLGYRAGTVLKGAAAVAAMIAISYKIYKNHISKAGKACKGKVGEDRKVCMKKYKKDALKKRLEMLNKGYTACSKSNNPITCKSKIDKEREKVKKKLKRL
jgi:hypothetical protein